MTNQDELARIAMKSDWLLIRVANTGRLYFERYRKGGTYANPMKLELLPSKPLSEIPAKDVERWFSLGEVRT